MTPKPSKNTIHATARRFGPALPVEGEPEGTSRGQSVALRPAASNPPDMLRYSTRVRARSRAAAGTTDLLFALPAVKNPGVVEEERQVIALFVRPASERDRHIGHVTHDSIVPHLATDRCRAAVTPLSVTGSGPPVGGQRTPTQETRTAHWPAEPGLRRLGSSSRG